MCFAIGLPTEAEAEAVTGTGTAVVGLSLWEGGLARVQVSIQPTTTGRARRTMMVTDGPWWVQLSVSLLAAGCFGSFLGGLVAFGLRDFLSIVMLIICPSFCCAVTKAAIFSSTLYTKNTDGDLKPQVSTSG